MKKGILRSLLEPILELREKRRQKINDLMTHTPLPQKTRAVTANILKTTYLPKEHHQEPVEFEVEDTEIRRLKKTPPP